MDDFTEDLAAQLSSKDWLFKTASDGTASTPYLFKCLTSPDNRTCCFIISDTKRVWAEVLDGKQLLRRWRLHNRTLASSSDETDAATKMAQLQALSTLEAIHTMRGMSLSSFTLIPSREADLAFEVCYEDYTWQWHTNALGYRTSAELISKQLILPLIAFGDLASTATESLQQISNIELEKIVDKNGRLYRRRVDAQIKKTMTVPKFATMLTRINALYSSLTDLPNIKSELEETGPEVPEPVIVAQTSRLTPRPATPPSRLPETPGMKSSPGTMVQADSATEDESDEPPPRAAPSTSRTKVTDPSILQEASTSAPKVNKRSSDSDSDSPRPVKKLKKPAVTDSDSSPPAKSVGRGGGVRQPIKRGGRRF